MSVWFGPSVASARRARNASARRARNASARGARDASARDAAAKAGAGRPSPAPDLASPRATAALVRALASGEPVFVVDPPRRSADWERAKRKVLLPPPPGLLHAAIGGIAAHEAPPRKPDGRAGATRAHWIPGDLTDARAAAILASPPVSPLWVVEDFRRLRVGSRMETMLETAGIRIAAYRALRVARRRGRR